MLVETQLVEVQRAEAQAVRVLPPSSRWGAVRGDHAGLPAVPAHVFPHRSAAQLLALARRGLDDAVEQRADGLRYATAHLAALRAAAAIVAARAKPVPSPRSKLTSVWDLLAMVAPALGEWADYFAASASKRAAAEAGIPHVVSTREADDLVRAAASFIAIVERAVGHLAVPALLDDLVA
jgi:HEPN superfamily protein